MVFILTRLVYSHHSCYIAIFHPYKQVFTPPDWEFNHKYRCSQPKQWKFSRFSLSNWDILGISTKNPKNTNFPPKCQFFGKISPNTPKIANFPNMVRYGKSTYFSTHFYGFIRPKHGLCTGGFGSTEKVRIFHVLSTYSTPSSNSI